MYIGFGIVEALVNKSDIHKIWAHIAQPKKK